MIVTTTGYPRKRLGLAQSLGGLAQWLLAMREVARQRRQLAQLSDALLKDIGVTRADAERESALPFWRV